jgi:LuxR family transcriptional regulator, activator of tox operons
MQLHVIRDRSSGPAGLLGGALIGLIETVGLDEFPRRLLAAVHDVAGCDSMAAYTLGHDQSPRLLFAETVRGEGAVARQLANCYLSFYLQHDPIWEAMAGLPESSEFCAVEVSADDMRWADDHSQCVLRGHSRMSVTQVRDGRRLLVNFLRAGVFSADRRMSILEAADVLMPLVWRHETALRLSPEDARADLRRRFAQRAPSLSPRELDVCVLIATGLSSEGIALELGVSVNTILTYRKRAYARLGISSQNELMRSILM